MDFNKYYADQARGEYPVFRGVAFQHGYGIGGVFRRFFSWAIPLLRQHALPIAKNVGKEVIQNIASIATDAIEGKDIAESAKEKVQTALDKLKDQSGKGYKRKRMRDLKYPPKKKRKTKRKLDIFS